MNEVYVSRNYCAVPWGPAVVDLPLDRWKLRINNFLLLSIKKQHWTLLSATYSRHYHRGKTLLQAQKGPISYCLFFNRYELREKGLLIEESSELVPDVYVRYVSIRLYPLSWGSLFLGCPKEGYKFYMTLIRVLKGLAKQTGSQWIESCWRVNLSTHWHAVQFITTF